MLDSKTASEKRTENWEERTKIIKKREEILQELLSLASGTKGGIVVV